MLLWLNWLSSTFNTVGWDVLKLFDHPPLIRSFNYGKENNFKLYVQKLIFLLREIYFHDPLSTKTLTVQNLAFSWCQTLGRGDTRCRWYTRTIAAPKCSCRNELWYNRDFSPISMKKRPSLTLALVFQRYSKTNMTLTTWWNWNGAQELILKIGLVLTWMLRSSFCSSQFLQTIASHRF